MRKHWKRLAAPVWTLVIWGHSLVPSDQSAAESGWVLQWFVPFFRLIRLPETVWMTLVRKLGHMSEYAVLGLLWSMVLLPRERSGRLDGAVRVLGLCLLTALTDETIQLHVPGRSGQVTDVWIDFLGAVLGLLLALLARRLSGRRRNK